MEGYRSKTGKVCSAVISKENNINLIKVWRKKVWYPINDRTVDVFFYFKDNDGYTYAEIDEEDLINPFNEPYHPNAAVRYYTSLRRWLIMCLMFTWLRPNTLHIKYGKFENLRPTI